MRAVVGIQGTYVGMDDDGRIEVECASGLTHGVKVSDRDRELINVRGYGSELHLHVREVVNENDVTLLGFVEMDDRRCFDGLVRVDGIGPGTAMRVLSLLSAERVIEAVREKHPTTFTGIPGIGPKTAKKIIEEVRL